MNQKIVIIPTYNEIENIEKIIHSIFKLEEQFDILIVDDSSPDGTNLKVQSMQLKYYNKLFLKIRKKKDGLGKAYIQGFKWCLNRNYDYIFQMDADFSHNPKDLIKLYHNLLNSNNDMIIGSRYFNNGINIINWPINRIILSYIGSIYVRLITGIPIYDTTAGFIGYKKETLKKLDINTIQFSGYGFQIEMKFKIWKLKLKIKEIPIVFTHRMKGESKLDIKIIQEAIFGIFKLKFQN